MAEKQVEKLMRLLDISEEEALQVIADDKAIDKGEKLFEQTKEQKAVSKKIPQKKNLSQIWHNILKIVLKMSRFSIRLN